MLDLPTFRIAALGATLATFGAACSSRVAPSDHSSTGLHHPACVRIPVISSELLRLSDAAYPEAKRRPEDDDAKRIVDARGEPFESEAFPSRYWVLRGDSIVIVFRISSDESRASVVASGDSLVGVYTHWNHRHGVQTRPASGRILPCDSPGAPS